MIIKRDDLTSQNVIDLISEHVNAVAENAGLARPQVLDMDHLRQPDVLFWTAWINGELGGMAALKLLETGHGELKSFRTVDAFRNKGIGTRLLDHLIEEAKAMGLTRLSLGTGNSPYYQPAIKLYRSRGFCETKPFADYGDDPNSYFMTRDI